MIGPRDLTVVVNQSQTLVSQIQDLFQRAEATEATMAVMNRPRVSNTAAHILLVAAGKQSFGESTSDWFATLGSNIIAVAQLLEGTSVRPEKFITEADRVITRRNNTFHFRNLAALDEEVVEVSKIITPALKKTCYWECWVIARYPVFKQVFDL